MGAGVQSFKNAKALNATNKTFFLLTFFRGRLVLTTHSDLLY